jgi:8-oxo-dGTP pyrophosphatase MutT (NUDIX family)
MSTEETQKKILFETPRFNVVKNIGKTGLEFKKITVGVLPYTINEKLLSSIGVLHEYNSFREKEFCDTLITGTMDPEDATLLHTAIRELKEEGGFECTDVDRWIFLGSFRVSKSSNEHCHIYAVDVTDLKAEKPVGDGSIQEEKSKFEMKGINDALLTDEALFLAAYLRLFDFFYQKNK